MFIIVYKCLILGFILGTFIDTFSPINASAGREQSELVQSVPDPGLPRPLMSISLTSDHKLFKTVRTVAGILTT
jgi:hypothetical protein